MKKVVSALGTMFCLAVLAPGLGAQDYRGRVQGAVSDASQGTLPGVTGIEVEVDESAGQRAFYREALGQSSQGASPRP